MDNNYERESSGMYYYTRPIGVYVFAGVSALSLIIQIASDGGITGMSVFIAILWGVLAWGSGNLLWAVIGDIITPYIYGREHTSVAVNTGTRIDISQEVISEGKFNYHSNKVIKDHKLWAKGMVALDEGEEVELSQYIRERWFSPVDDIELPDYISLSLREKMRDRQLVTGNSITPYGEKVFPMAQPLDDTIQA